MRLKLWVFVILACAAVPAAAAGAKLAGKVLGAAALSKVRTYCVDTSNLEVPEARVAEYEEFAVRELVKAESGPKGLLSKLPWRLEANCSAPGLDAVLWFEFPLAAARGWEARSLVSDKASSRVIYIAEGNSLGYRLGGTGDDIEVRDELHCRDAAYNALWALVSDVKAISKKR
jgi:hypothetical protein